MLIDTHVHTDFSFDCKMPLAEALAGAKANEVGLCITDHLDLNMDYKPFDPQAYRDLYFPLRSKGLFLGTECGMDPRFHDESRAYLSISSPDFTLGSVHTIGDLDIYEKSTYEAYTRDGFWQAYFAQALECLKTHPFIDSLAHLDYPARLSPYGETGFDFRAHEKGLLPIFEHLIRHDLALELNLRRFSPATRSEFREHFSVYRELGGRFVTLGTDSHLGQTIGAQFREAYGLLKELDLLAVHFENHEAVTDHLF